MGLSLRRAGFRYTPLFCEENIWWLARDMVDRGVAVGNLEVLLFSNPAQSVLMLNQQAAPPGRPVAWDYHVVLRAVLGDRLAVLDFDTRLGFPFGYRDYLARSFPQQVLLPEDYRAWVRAVPAADFLQRFASDRSHMRGRVPGAAFPGYPAIAPAAGAPRTTLAQYRDIRTTGPGTGRVMPLQLLLQEAAGSGRPSSG